MSGHDTGAPRKLRVVYIGHVAQMSGGEIALLRLLPHLHHVDPHVVLAEDGPLVGRLRGAGVPTEVLWMSARTRDVRKESVRPALGTVGALFGTAWYVLRLALRLRELRPDIVHTNTLKAGVYGSLAARLVGVPVVWHVRDRIADDYLPRSAVRGLRWLLRRLPNRVVTNSKATSATLHTEGREARFLVAPSVLPEVAARATDHTRVTDDEVRFGIVGRLAPWKGQDLVIEAFAAAFPRPGPERLTIVGSSMFGEDAYAARLPELARQLGVADRVELRGFKDDVWAELARMDVVLNASRSPEPFGQVVLEAMVAGRAVIVTDGGGPAEIVRRGGCGIVVEPNDAVSLAGAMRRLAENVALRERLGEAGRLASREYAPEHVAAEIEGLYFDVVSERRRAARVAARLRP